MHKCTKDKNMAGAWKIFGEMKRRHVMPDQYTYSILMNGCVKAGDSNSVFCLLDEMVDLGVRPNVIVFSTVIEACVVHADVPRALMLFKRMMQHHRLMPNVIVYTQLLNVCAKAGDLETAISTVNKMTVAGIKRDIVSYNTLFDTYAEATSPENGPGQWSNCLKLLEAMRNGGIKPDKRTYDALIKVCSRGGLIKKALEVLDLMHKHSLLPDVQTYTMLIHAYANATSLENVMKHSRECRRLLDVIKDKGLIPNVWVYNALVRVHTKGGMVKQALEMLETMRRHDVSPNQVTYGILIDGISKSENLTKEELLSASRRILGELKDRKIKQTVSTSTSLINLWSVIGNLREAEQQFDLLKRNRMKPDIACYGALIRCFEKLGDWSKGRHYLRPCLDLLAEAENDGLKLNDQVFTSVISACANAHDFDMALKMWNKMKQIKIQPSGYNFGAIIKACLYTNHLLEAYRFMKEMETEGILLNEPIFLLFLSFFEQREMEAEAKSMFRKMKQLGVEPGSKLRDLIKRLKLE